jgi:glycosyltransferase involved in cell wall biosynthesis
MQECRFDIELLIADDNSPDNTESIVHSFAYHPNFNRIKYTKHKENKGMMPNFIWALEHCTGKYIALCEGDDYWTDPLKLQKQVDFLEGNEDFAICGSLAKRIYEDESISSDIEGEFGIFTQIDLAQKNFIPTASVVIKKENISNLPAWFNSCPIGDWPLFLICSNYGKIKFFEEQMVVRRIHSNGVWGANIGDGIGIKNESTLVQLFDILRDKFDFTTNGIFQKQYVIRLMKLVRLHLQAGDTAQISFFLKLLLSEAFAINDESESLINALSNKIDVQRQTIEDLENINQLISESTSYKIGRKITKLFGFLKR